MKGVFMGRKDSTVLLHSLIWGLFNFQVRLILS